MSFLRLLDNKRLLVLPCLLILFVLSYFLILQTIIPNFFLYDDNLNAFLPFYKHNWNSVINNFSIPFINLHQYLGYTHLSQGQTGVFYPPVYLAGFLSKLITGSHFYTIDILVLIHLCFSVVGIYFLLKNYNIDTKLSFIFSLIWITFPFLIITSKSWVFISYSAAFLPYIFILLDRMLKNPGYKIALILGSLQALFYYQGYAQYVLMLLMFEFIYILIFLSLSTPITIDSIKEIFRSIIRNIDTNPVKLFKSYIVSKISFVCLSAPLLIPMFYQQHNSSYRSSQIPYHDFINHSLNILVFIKTQLGIITKYVVFSADSEIYFIGITNIVLLALIFKKINRSDKKIITLAALSLIALLFSTKFYSVFYEIPFLNVFRWPFKYFFFFLFFSILSIALISDNLLKTKNKFIIIMIYLGLVLTVGHNIYLVTKKPNNVAAKFHLSNKNLDYVNKYIDNSKGRIFTFGLHKIGHNNLNRYYTFNFATMYNKYHFAGYDPLLSSLNNRLVFGLNHKNTYNGTINQRLLDYLNNWSVRYLITKDDSFHDRLNQFQQLKLIYKGNNVRLYENHYAFPLVHYYDENINVFRKVLAENIEFEFKVNGIAIYPKNPESRKLIVNIAPLEFYKINIDGKDIGFVKKTDIPIALNIPPNTQIITITYVDYYFYSGLITAILFGLILLLIFIKTKYYSTNESVN